MIVNMTPLTFYVRSNSFGMCTFYSPELFHRVVLWKSHLRHNILKKVWMSLLPPWCERALHTQTSAGCPWSSSHWHWLGGDRFGGLPEGAVFFWWYVQAKYCLSFGGKKKLWFLLRKIKPHTHIYTKKAWECKVVILVSKICIWNSISSFQNFTSIWKKKHTARWALKGKFKEWSLEICRL